MRIHTEYMSFKNLWTITCSYDSQVHLQRSQWWYRLSLNALQWFVVLSGLRLVLPGAPRLVIGAPTLVVGTPKLGIGAPRLVVCAPRLVSGASKLVASAPRYSQLHPKFSPALWGVLKLIIITPMVLLYQSSEIPVALQAGGNALLGSDTLRNQRI
jgi:hypothetical protein